ncbi:MAG: hypothetical protein WBR18_02175, partial [Anaerolineales bacterium]
MKGGAKPTDGKQRAQGLLIRRGMIPHLLPDPSALAADADMAGPPSGTGWRHAGQSTTEVGEGKLVQPSRLT